MGALTKADLAERVAEETKMDKQKAKLLVDQVFESIRSALSNGSPVRLSGFGNFDLRDKRERPGRNPKTKEEIPVSARRVVNFHAGQKLKHRVEQYTDQD